MTPTTDRRYLWLFAILALVGLVADQASKYFIFAKIYPEPGRTSATYEIIPDWFSLQTNYSPKQDSGDEPLSFLRTISGPRVPYVNKGALFGFGNAEDGGWNIVFMCVSILAAGFIIFWVRRPHVACDRVLCLALGLILAGTLGNLIDRIVFGGVRDFLHCYYVDASGIVHIWPDFNIADCCLVLGAGLLLVHSFFAKDPASEPAKTQAAPVEAVAPAPTDGAMSSGSPA